MEEVGSWFDIRNRRILDYYKRRVRLELWRCAYDRVETRTTVPRLPSILTEERLLSFERLLRTDIIAWILI